MSSTRRKAETNTPGASCSQIRTRLGTILAAVASAMASTKLDWAWPGSKVSGDRVSLNRARASRTDGHRASATGVGSTP